MHVNQFVFTPEAKTLRDDLCGEGRKFNMRVVPVAGDHLIVPGIKGDVPFLVSHRELRVEEDEMAISFTLVPLPGFDYTALR